MTVMTIYAKVRITLSIDDDIYMKNDEIDVDFINECEYGFKSHTNGVKVADTEIIEHEVIEQKRRLTND